PRTAPTTVRNFESSNNYSLKKSSLQMLDAAHGEAVRPIEIALHVDGRRIEIQTACTGVAGGVRRRTPAPTSYADTRQSSRRVDAVARSRRSKAIAGMDAGKETFRNE
ncbi:MAG: hypothetical protein NC131_18955, partial [Roseburia sp.]|nr:hypothetical protein [Roseburia sp.]